MTTPQQSDPGERAPYLYGISGLGVVYKQGSRGIHLFLYNT